MKQADYTISDIIRLKPTWFLAKQSNPDSATTHLDSIARMIDYGFGHIADYKFRHCFGGFDISTKSIGEINKAIAEYIEPLLPETLVPRLSSPVFTNHEKLLSLARADHNTWENRIRASTQAAEGALSDVNYYNEKVEEAIREVGKAYKALRDHEAIVEALNAKYEAVKNKLDLSKIRMLKSIPSHWTVIDVTQSEITLFRTRPVTIRWTNANTGMNKTLYMGFYAFKLNIEDFSLIKAQVVADGQCHISPCHPHISSYICFGNMQHQAQKAKENNDLGKFLIHVDAILETYNEGNPFRALTTYINGKNKNYHSVHTNPIHSWFKSQQFYAFLNTHASANYVPHTVSQWSQRIDKQRSFVVNMTNALDYRRDKIRMMNESYSSVPESFKPMTNEDIARAIRATRAIRAYTYTTNDDKHLLIPACYANITHRDYYNRCAPVVIACMRVMGIKRLRMKDFTIEIRGDFPQMYFNSYGDRYYVYPAPNSVIVKIIDDAGEVVIDEGKKDPVLTDFESTKEEVAEEAVPF